MAEDLSWSVLYDLQSDHLPIKISWRKTFKVEKEKRSVDWDVDEADCVLQRCRKMKMYHINIRKW